ncbi:hypothetical protein HK104_001102 [Borealophlyctis nickersoniae]|nr:hypothetical protein HK104_001102 [Borealophlyctis nickersoniae]
MVAGLNDYTTGWYSVPIATRPAVPMNYGEVSASMPADSFPYASSNDGCCCCGTSGLPLRAQPRWDYIPPCPPTPFLSHADEDRENWDLSCRYPPTPFLSYPDEDHENRDLLCRYPRSPFLSDGNVHREKWDSPYPPTPLWSDRNGGREGWNSTSPYPPAPLLPGGYQVCENWDCISCHPPTPVPSSPEIPSSGPPALVTSSPTSSYCPLTVRYDRRCSIASTATSASMGSVDSSIPYEFRDEEQELPPLSRPCEPISHSFEKPQRWDKKDANTMDTILRRPASHVASAQGRLVHAPLIHPLLIHPLLIHPPLLKRKRNVDNHFDIEEAKVYGKSTLYEPPASDADSDEASASPPPPPRVRSQKKQKLCSREKEKPCSREKQKPCSREKQKLCSRKKQKSEQGTGEYACDFPDCGKTFVKSDRLRSHSVSHSGE